MKQKSSLTDNMRREIRGALAEIDMKQMKIISAMTVAQRCKIGFQMTEDVFQVAIYRLRLKEPELLKVEARRRVLEEYYRQNPSHYLPLRRKGDDLYG